MDTIVFDAVFWSFFITTIIGFLLKMTSMAYKSKCKEVSCCCIKIIRDTEAEIEFAKAEIGMFEKTPHNHPDYRWNSMRISHRKDGIKERTDFIQKLQKIIQYRNDNANNL